MLGISEANVCAKKTDGIVSQIAKAILLGKIEGESEITQNDLAKSLEVSRMPVREALIILEHAGLVERLHNQHIKVARISRAFFYEIFHTVFLFESELIKKMVDDKKKIAKFLSISCELQFHVEFAKAADSLFTKKILETLTDIYIPFAISSKKHDAEKSFSLLKEIFTASQEDDRNNLLEKYFSELADDASFAAKVA